MTILAIRSGKGGAGRTSLTVLLGCALARQGVDVTVLDLDRQDALRLYCGETTPRRSGLAGPDLEQVRLDAGFSYIAQDAATCALLMGGGPHAAQRAPGLLQRWLGTPALLLVDMPAVEDAVAGAVADMAGLHLRPFLPETGSLALAQPTDAAFSRTAYVLNRADCRRPLTDAARGFLGHVVGARFIGEVRRDEAVPEATASLKMLPDYDPTSAAWRDIEALAKNLQIRFGAAARYEAASGCADVVAARRA